ncbi:MAG: hypothetical protein LIO75_07490 [Lachnospiraceae bacterium]|nr:hypothetical protein [Lachnospiraceae bacterium]
MEASKISSGVITLDMREIDLKQLIIQTSGEFDDQLQARDLQLILSLPETEMWICADGRRSGALSGWGSVQGDGDV